MPALCFCNHRIRSALRGLRDHDAERMKTRREKSINVSISKGGNKKIGADELWAANICATCMQPCARVQSGVGHESSPILVTPFRKLTVKTVLCRGWCTGGQNFRTSDRVRTVP
jgi:hypothetical protein